MPVQMLGTKVVTFLRPQIDSIDSFFTPTEISAYTGLSYSVFTYYIFIIINKINDLRNK